MKTYKIEAYREKRLKTASPRVAAVGDVAFNRVNRLPSDNVPDDKLHAVCYFVCAARHEMSNN